MSRRVPCVPLFIDRAQADDYAARLQIVADETRLRIILALRGGEMVIGQLAESLGTDSAVVAEHLNALCAALVVRVDLHHGQMHYSLRPGLLRIESGMATIDLGSVRLRIPV